MDNILVTGANGQLGSELRSLTTERSNFIFTDVEQLDICDYEAVDSYITTNGIKTIINCAAYTNVDKAEEEPELAFKINSKGPETLARAAKRNSATLVHVSTDYVFNGEGKRPYTEWDKCDPKTAYGRGKRSGELIIKKLGCKGIIIRTAWLYSSFGNNFVKTMLRLGEERGAVSVVNDQFGTPTYANDLAAAILHILPQLDEFPRYGEIFNYTDDGFCSWCEFAEKIMELKRLPCEVIPVTTEEYGSTTPRPMYSVLDKTLIKTAFDVAIPKWERSLTLMLRKV